MTELIMSLRQSTGFWKTLMQKIKQYRTYKQTYKELSQLTDHELADIGLHRSQLKSIAMEAYHDNRIL